MRPATLLLLIALVASACSTAVDVPRGASDPTRLPATSDASTNLEVTGARPGERLSREQLDLALTRSGWQEAMSYEVRFIFDSEASDYFRERVHRGTYSSDAEVGTLREHTVTAPQTTAVPADFEIRHTGREAWVFDSQGWRGLDSEGDLTGVARQAVRFDRGELDFPTRLLLLRQKDLAVVDVTEIGDGGVRWTVTADITDVLLWLPPLASITPFERRTRTNADHIPIQIDVGANGFITQINLDFTRWYATKLAGDPAAELPASVTTEVTLTNLDALPEINAPCAAPEIEASDYFGEVLRCNNS